MPVIETADRGSSDVDISDDDEYADAQEVMEDDDYFLSQGELLQRAFHLNPILSLLPLSRRA